MTELPGVKALALIPESRKAPQRADAPVPETGWPPCPMGIVHTWTII